MSPHMNDTSGTNGLTPVNVILVILASAAICLLAIGFSTPGWLVVTFQEQRAREDYTVVSLNRSLFYDVFCPQNMRDCKVCDVMDTDVCIEQLKSKDYTGHFRWIERLTAGKEGWTVWRIIMTVVITAAAIGVILVLVLVCCRLKPAAYKIVACSGSMIWLLSGLIVWIPVVMITDMQVSVKDDINTDVVAEDGVNHDATLHVPYSVILTAVGAFMALITGLMLFWVTGACVVTVIEDTEMVESRRQSETSKSPEQMYQGLYGHFPSARNVYFRDQVPEFYLTSVYTDDMHVTPYPVYYWPPLQPIYDNQHVQPYGSYM